MMQTWLKKVFAYLLLVVCTASLLACQKVPRDMANAEKGDTPSYSLKLDPNRSPVEEKK